MRAVLLEFDAAHHVVGRRHHLDPVAGQVEAAVGAAPDHALEAAAHLVRAQMLHLDVDAAVGRGVAGAHLGIHGAGDDIAGRPLAALGSYLGA